MLPTEEAKNKLISDRIDLILVDKRLFNPFKNEYYHLYFISDDEPKMGDIAMITDINNINYGYTVRITIESDLSIYRKIAATTNPNLWKDRLENNGLGFMPENYKRIKGIDKVPLSFIEAFVREQGAIDKVMLEYEYIVTNEDFSQRPVFVSGYEKLKLRNDGTVSIFVETV